MRAREEKVCHKEFLGQEALNNTTRSLSQKKGCVNRNEPLGKWPFSSCSLYCNNGLHNFIQTGWTFVCQVSLKFRTCWPKSI